MGRDYFQNLGKVGEMVGVHTVASTKEKELLRVPPPCTHTSNQAQSKFRDLGPTAKRLFGKVRVLRVLQILLQPRKLYLELFSLVGF